ncbi:MAG: hypothetical protein JW795_05850 [Chitinivibrionales bacterium]|nr:hypothetical protein [Chitinivibrionales bacterium]
MNLNTRNWKFLVYSSHLYLIGLIIVYYWQNVSSPLSRLTLIFLIFSSAIEVAAFIVYRWFVRDIRSIIIFRIYVDNSLFILSFLIPCFYLNLPPVIFCTLSLFLLESLINMTMLNSKIVNYFIDCSVLSVCIISLFMLPFNYAVIVNSIGIIILGICILVNSFLSSRRSFYEELVALHTGQQELKDLLVSLVKHELINIQTFAFNMIQIKAQNRSHDIEALLKTTFEKIESLVLPIIGEKHTSIKLHHIVYEIVNYCTRRCIEKNSIVDIAVQVSDVRLKINYAVIYLALSVVLTNAIESSAKKIIISFKDNILSVEDDGEGMDPAKIKPHFTTKSYGHGVGLVTSISILEKHNIGLSISSQPFRGTTVSFDLSKVIG